MRDITKILETETARDTFEFFILNTGLLVVPFVVSDHYLHSKTCISSSDATFTAKDFSGFHSDVVCFSFNGNGSKLNDTSYTFAESFHNLGFLSSS